MAVKKVFAVTGIWGKLIFGAQGANTSMRIA